jgi:hypothetical protein
MDCKNLEDLLIEDWTWRKKEISDLILLAEKEESAVLLKSIILLLYAHWEGYIKKSGKCYLKFVAENKIKVCDLTENFKAICLKGLSKEVLSSNNSLNLSNEFKLILKYSKLNDYTLDKLIKVDLENDKDKQVIDTHDNLNPAVFKNILSILGLTYKKQYESREKFIENHLLANRNSIGHGSKKLFIEEDFDLEINSIKKLRDIIISIIENFRDELIEYSREKYFLEANTEKVTEFLNKMEIQLEDLFREIESRYLK